MNNLIPAENNCSIILSCLRNAGKELGQIKSSSKKKEPGSKYIAPVCAATVFKF